MTSTAHAAPAEPAPAPRAMTRCECAGITFSEIAHRMREEGISLEEVLRRTGCGGTCTACIPDLRQYLSSPR